MPKRSSRGDLNQTAFSVVRDSTRTDDKRTEQSNREAEAADLKYTKADEQIEKNPAAVALGRLGGLKGGKARASKLSAAERKKIAQKAAKKRWATK